MTPGGPDAAPADVVGGLGGFLACAAAVALSSCAGADQQGSPAHRMSAWVDGTGFGQAVGTLVADNARIALVAGRGSGALHAACSTIINDAQAANGNLPSPDPDVTDILTRAYGLEGTAGNDCYGASGNASLLGKSEREGIEADALYDEAVQRIRAVDGKAPVTTTTAGNSGNFGSGGDLRVSAVAGGDELDRHRRRVLWALPTGLYLVGSRHEEECNLMTANLVVQVCLEPKLVGVALERDSVTARLVTGGRGFALSLLARGDRDVVRRFVKPVTEVERSAEGVLVSMSGHRVTEMGQQRLPVLAAAAGSIVCTLHRTDLLGSHLWCVGEVAEVAGEPSEVLRMEDTRMHYGG